MRNSDELVSRIRQLRNGTDDLLGFRKEALSEFLTYDEFVQAFDQAEDPKLRKEWDAKPRTREYVLFHMAGYMRFAWDKVQDHRGISASRSVEKMAEWVWLLGDDQLLVDLESTPYPQYGAPKLKLVCERLGFPVPTEPEILRMAVGDPCVVGCRHGCGT